MPTFIEPQRKQGNSRKTSTSASLTMLKPLTVWINKVWKILRDENTIPHYLSPDKPVCGPRSNSLELDMKQWTGSKLGKENIKAVYCHPAYLTYMKNTCEMPGWVKHKLDARFLGEISITSVMQMTPPL